MTSPRRILFDLDGLFCDFNTSFLRLLQTIEGRPLGPFDARAVNSPRYKPQTFGWYTELGFRQETLDRARVHTEHAERGFWTGLAALHDERQTEALLWDVTRWAWDLNVEIHFVTNRPGLRAREQSVEWLRRHGTYSPSVLTTRDKAAIAKGLDAALLIDDHTDNCLSVAEGSGAQVVIVDAAYNQHCPTHARIDRIPNTLEAITSYLQVFGVLNTSFRLPPPR